MCGLRKEKELIFKIRTALSYAQKEKFYSYSEVSEWEEWGG